MTTIRLLFAAHVEAADYFEQALDVVSVVGDDDRVVGGKCRDQAVVRDHRLDDANDGSGVDILKPHHPRDVLVALGLGGVLRFGQRGDERTLRAGTILMTWPAWTVVKPFTWSTD